MKRVRDFLLSDRFPLLLAGILLLSLLPWASVFTSEPSTGGDTASHFWPLENMLRLKTLRPWNPGNLAGEPQLVHYFPLSFILMAFVALVFPAGFAFNWVAILSTLLLPFAVYWGLKRMRSPAYTPVLGAALTIPFLMNTSYSAWGGNLLSTLAGQFAHAYALVFFFLFLGMLESDFEKKRPPLRSGVLAACVVLSHAYVALALPVACLAMLLVGEGGGEAWRRLKTSAGAGLIALVLTIWWIVPSVQSNAWTTPYSGRWLDNLDYLSYLPKMFLPYAIAIPLLLVNLFSNPAGRVKLGWGHGRHLMFWTVLALFYLHMVWAFPLLGLVDIRALPQVQLFVFVGLAVLLAAFLSTLPTRVAAYGAPLLALAAIVHGYSARSTSMRWLRWNWSGWSAKPAYRDFLALNRALRGDYSQPRVAFEQSEEQSKTGTIRAFEMLPYFAGRATTESLYMQATTYAPAAFYLQSLIGEARSCPFPELPCGTLNLGEAYRYFSWLGVNQIILTSAAALAQANAMTPAFFSRQGTYGPWTVYEVNERVELAEAFTQRPAFSDVPKKFWKSDALKRMVEHKPGEAWVVNRTLLPEGITAQLESWNPSATRDCRVKLAVAGQSMTLATKCPGTPHVVKMAYNPGFRADSGDRLFPVYPGYIGIIPSAESVTLRFGAAPTWRVFDGLSLIAWLSGFGVAGKRLRAIAKIAHSHANDRRLSTSSVAGAWTI